MGSSLQAIIFHRQNIRQTRKDTIVGDMTAEQRSETILVKQNTVELV